MRITSASCLSTVALAFGLFAIAPPSHLGTVEAVAENLPAEIRDPDYWQLISDLSEPTSGDKYPGGNNLKCGDPSAAKLGCHPF